LLGEDLRNSAPTDVFYEDALFIFRRIACFRIESVRKLDGCKVVPRLLLRGALAERIRISDAVVLRV
jgi:hypothetical protein